MVVGSCEKQGLCLSDVFGLVRLVLTVLAVAFTFWMLGTLRGPGGRYWSKPLVADDGQTTMSVSSTPRWNTQHSQCSEIPIPEEYWRLDARTTSQFVFIPRLRDITAGQSVCVRVVVPAEPRLPQETRFAPLPEMPVWDSVLLDMVGNNTGVNVPVDLKPAPDRRNKDRRSTHIYQADVVLRDADTYRPQGYLEFRDAQWNPDDGGTPQLVPEDLTVVDWMKVTVVDDGQSPYNLKRYPGLPLCTEMDMDGRWVPAASLPFSPSLVPTADHHGLVWLPYDCRLRNIPYRNFVKDLTETNKLVHWFGDNNMQRSAKKITSLGAWCMRPRSLTQKSICYCDDAKERFSKYNVNRQETVVELTMSGGGRSIATQRFSTKDIRGGRARMVLFKMDGLSDRLQPGRKNAGNKEPNWKQRFESGMVRRLGSPSMVIVSLSNWGPALSTRTSFIQDLHLLVTHLKSTYVSGIKVVLRTGQYFCCRSDPMGSKYRNSRLRDRSFDNLIISTFRQTLGNVFDIRVWDVARISERRPHAFRLEDPRCLTNYSPSDIVDVENQVLFNHLANSRLLLD